MDQNEKSTVSVVFTEDRWDGNLGPKLIIKGDPSFWERFEKSILASKLDTRLGKDTRAILEFRMGSEVGFLRTYSAFEVILTEIALGRLRRMASSLSDLSMKKDDKFRGGYHYFDLESLGAEGGREDFIIIAEVRPFSSS